MTDKEDPKYPIYHVAARWRGMEDSMPEGWQVDVWSEFSLALSKLEDLSEIRQLRQQGDLSRVTAISEYTRRGVISDRIDPEEEAERVDDEGMANAARFGFDTEGNESEDSQDDQPEMTEDEEPDADE